MKRFPLPAILGTVALAAFLAGCSGGDDAGESADTTGDAATATSEAPAATPAPVETTPPAATHAEGALLDPETATREQLLAVPGLNETLADQIIGGRPYADMRAVDRVLAAGNLSEQQREEVYRHLWKPLDLNSASGEEILLIPGVGERMEHEFEEYRPYRNIEQFRREIGKYVEEPEVARLERYVTIRS